MDPGFAKLIKTEGRLALSRKTDAEFFFSLQQALLMMLKEEAFLTETQLLQALALLRREYGI